jgi:hypothetical protein
MVKVSTAIAGGAMAASPSLAKTLVLGNAYEIDPLVDPRWAAFVDRHPQSSVFHGTKWLRALKSVYGYDSSVITASAPGCALTNGLVFCRIKSWLTGRRLVSLPFSDHCEPLLESPEELDHLLQHAQQQVAREKWKYLEIRPMACDPSRQTGLSRHITYHFHSLDLRPSLAQLFKNFHKDCVQRKIRRAEREQLHYEAGTSEALLRKFYRLLVMTRRRQYLPPQPMAWFRGLIAAFGDDLKIRLASKDGVALAGILTLSHKKCMVYKYGCSDAAFNNLGGTPLLFWKAIQEAKHLGMDQLEMGRCDLDNSGLAVFKERWGASRRSISYWTFPRQPLRTPSLWKNGLEKRTVSVLPDFALEAVGGLLYKHIG